MLRFITANKASKLFLEVSFGKGVGSGLELGFCKTELYISLNVRIS